MGGRGGGSGRERVTAKIEHSDKEANNLKKVENASANKKVEHFSGLDASGNLIFKNIKGDAEYVDISASDMELLRGGILTHNHPLQYPGEIAQFSKEDLDVAINAGLKEIRAVNPLSSVAFARDSEAIYGASIWGNDQLKREFLNNFHRPYKEARAALKQISGKMSPKQLADFWAPYEKRTHDFMNSRENQERYGFKYEQKRR